MASKISPSVNTTKPPAGGSTSTTTMRPSSLPSRTVPVREAAFTLHKWKTANKDHKPTAAYVIVPDYHLLPRNKVDQAKELDALKNKLPVTVAPTDDACVYNFQYMAPEVHGDADKIKSLLDEEELQKRARALSDKVRQEVPEGVPVVLIGYGYGGIICELVSLFSEQQDKTHVPNFNLLGVVLMGTPHFHAGLAQWASLCAAIDPRSGAAAAGDPKVWEKYKLSLDAITKEQELFRRNFDKPNARLRVSISPDWCSPPGFWIIKLDATYMQMTSFAHEVDYADVCRIVQAWMVTFTGVGGDDAAGADDPSKPRVERGVRPKSRFHTYPSGVRSRPIAVGSVLATAGDMEVLATAQEIWDALQHDEKQQQGHDSSNNNIDTSGRQSKVNPLPSPPIHNNNTSFSFWASPPTPQQREEKTTQTQEGGGGRGGGIMINQDSAIRCARAASKLAQVRRHMRSKGSAYLVVANGAIAAAEAGSSGGGPDPGAEGVEGVRLWEVKYVPSSRSKNGSSLRGSVRSMR
ncbi:hypothetical protein B0H66DRAFT_526601 [Apodospora peruviana]|uniref:DUF676 domain-containing protein n=1 Tax=Apodospora peruviana TaxID=516989 RepID=A0AAE0ME87_9PEZI|nr:hypothetical protein B0H66DRAFT_526601 [Apodospora peruviana]